MKILLIEDDEVLARSLKQALTAREYLVDMVADGEAGWESIEAFTYDLILLDIILPKLDGIALCRQLRSRGIKTPVILITAVDNSSKKAIGLDAGADDYITKPFDLEELLARIRALLRRGLSELPPVLSWGKLALNPSTMEVSSAGKPLRLTPKEYSLLELFLRNPRRVFSRSSILDRVWSFEEFPAEDTVTAHIKGLRMKIKNAGAGSPIETVYGVGYRLKATPQTDLPQQEYSSAKPKQKTKTRLTTPNLWQNLKVKFNSRVTTLSRATDLLSKNSLDPRSRLEAIDLAHKLIGSLGMCNLMRASHLAREVEQLFTQSPSLDRLQKKRLAELVTSIRQELELATNVQFSDILDLDRRPLLLIIDSDRDLRETLLVESAKWGIRAIVAEEIRTAVEKIELYSPDLILLGLDSQDTKLLELLSPFSKPVLVLSSKSSLLDRLELARAGKHKFLQKPIAPPQILEAVTRVLNFELASKPKVMVVNDNTEVLTSLENLLKPEGIDVFTLADPLKFWETLEATAPDLLILDVEMPSISGIDLCRVVRNDLGLAGLPILFITDVTDAKTKELVFAVGGDDYLSKPLVPSQLLTRIHNRLQRKRF